MRRDHKPYWLKRLHSKLNRYYVQRIVRPQFDALGQHPMVLQARSLEVHGHAIRAGNYLHIISHKLRPVRFTTWSSKQNQGQISIGNYCLISPGVEITSALSICIEDNCMIAADCIISDSDWHGLYNRLRPFRCSKAIHLHDNVWVGARCIIGKGVSIGENSVIGAGSVVTGNIPANVVAAGNPARVIKHLNPKRKMLKREFLFKNGESYWHNQEAIDQYFNHQNRSWRWLKSKIAPSHQD